MKKIILVALSLLMTIGIASAQQPQQRGGQRPSPEKQMEQQLTNMKSKLKLSDDQVVKLEELFVSVEAQRRSGDFDPRAQREAINKEVGKILTKEQQADWAKMLEEQKKQMESRRGGGARRRR